MPTKWSSPLGVCFPAVKLFGEFFNELFRRNSEQIPSYVMGVIRPEILNCPGGFQLTDDVDLSTRSKMMSRIRFKNTGPEMMLRSALFRRGVRYRLHSTHLPGKPDLVFARYRAVVFVHGCFWHRHKSCKFATTPVTRREFWLKKFEGNATRSAPSAASRRIRS